VINAGGGGMSIGYPLGGTNGLHWEGKNQDDNIFLSRLWLSYDLIETLGMEILSGHSFSRNFGSHEQVIFNEEAIKLMGFEDPIGKNILLDGEERQIGGVVKNFHFESLYEKIKPCVLLVAPVEYAPKVSVRIEAGAERLVLKRVKTLFEQHNPGLEFDFKFLSDDYQRLYASEIKVSVLSRYFAGIAVLVSCLGVFGLAAFTAERRLKEIGIRKVLGATELSIINLLSSDFFKIILASILIALPLSYIIAAHWLDSFAFKIELEWWYFVVSALVALSIALLTVGTQALKAAQINPAKCLKDE
jgi:hypothetical protein